MPVYHFSQEPDIQRFVPREPAPVWSALGPVVWAIDEWHAPMYHLPRDCPRVCFYPLASTTVEDRERYWSAATARMVIAIEAAWLERMRSTVVYRYTLPEVSFTRVREPTYYLVSKEPVDPLRVEPLGDLIQAITSAGVELRICPSLADLGRGLAASSMQFSLIRMRNAQGK